VPSYRNAPVMRKSFIERCSPGGAGTRITLGLAPGEWCVSSTMQHTFRHDNNTPAMANTRPYALLYLFGRR